MKLDGLQPDLYQLILTAKDVCPGFKVIEGIRSEERQKELFDQGASKTLNSKHLTGEAIDFIPDPFTGWNNLDAFTEIGECFKELNPNVVYGGDWGWDYGHIELEQTVLVPVSEHSDINVADGTLIIGSVFFIIYLLMNKIT